MAVQSLCIVLGALKPSVKMNKKHFFFFFFFFASEKARIRVTFDRILSLFIYFVTFNATVILFHV